MTEKEATPRDPNELPLSEGGNLSADGKSRLVFRISVDEFPRGVVVPMEKLPEITHRQFITDVVEFYWDFTFEGYLFSLHESWGDYDVWAEDKHTPRDVSDRLRTLMEALAQQEQDREARRPGKRLRAWLRRVLKR